MTLIQKILPTTVVGSYPPARPGGLRSLLDPFRQALESAVEDQIAAGIDIISTGQVRGDMIGSFTSQLPGIRGQSVNGIVGPSPKPITVADTKFALSRHRKVKGIITGPSTMAHGLKINTPCYRSREELVLDLAQALAVEAMALEGAGVTLIQIDEPILSTGTADWATAKRAVQIITSVVRVPTCLHVCGELTETIDQVLKLQVDIFDFEFAGCPSNREVVAARDLKERKLGYGVVDSADETVESVEEIRKRILEAVDAFGAETLLIDPDCGLRMRSRESAFAKLSNMAKAAEQVRRELA